MSSRVLIIKHQLAATALILPSDAKGDSWTKRSGIPTACMAVNALRGRQAGPLLLHTYSGEREPLQAIEPPGREDEADYQGGVWCTPLVSALLLSGSGCRVKRWGG